jgi:hypothetical protein
LKRLVGAEMIEQYSTSAALFVAAAVLFYLGLPNKAGENRRFLRFEAAPLLYPPVIMALLAFSIIAFLSGSNPH